MSCAITRCALLFGRPPSLPQPLQATRPAPPACSRDARANRSAASREFMRGSANSLVPPHVRKSTGKRCGGSRGDAHGAAEQECQLAHPGARPAEQHSSRFRTLRQGMREEVQARRGAAGAARSGAGRDSGRLTGCLRLSSVAQSGSKVENMTRRPAPSSSTTFRGWEHSRLALVSAWRIHQSVGSGCLP